MLPRAVFDELSAADDARIVFGGIGDPLLHPDFAAIVESAHRAGIGAIAVETDLLEIDAEQSTVWWISRSTS